MRAEKNSAESDDFPQRARGAVFRKTTNTFMRKFGINKNNIHSVIFIAAFGLCLMLPLCFMNLKKDQLSEIENKKLADWPNFETSEDYLGDVNKFIDDRIGFREPAIGLYTEANNKLFDVMVNPLFMWGQNGHIYYKDKDYIAAYQRLNTDKDFIDSMVSFLCATNDYLASKDIKFMYYVCPDKKTIYPENFPETVNVNYENESVLEYLDESMAKTDVTYINPKPYLEAVKDNIVLYNKMYDATHWNDRGAFIGHSLIDEKVQEWFDDVPPLEESSFDLGTVHMDSLDNAKFSIDEDVPLYTLRDDYTADYTELLRPTMDCNTDTFYTHHINNTAPNNRILLVFTDSYFQSYQKFYDNRFKEVYFVHRQNYAYLQYFVNLVFPDMVIFETAERSISSEIPLLADFSDCYYEAPYMGDGNFSDRNDVTYTVTGCSGGIVEGDKIYLDPNDTTSIFRCDCVLEAGGREEDFDVYISTDDECMETEYLELKRQSNEEGISRFSFSIQRRYMAQSKMNLFAYDKKTKETILLTTFEVVYNG